MDLYFHQTPVSLGELAASFTNKDLASPSRSTLPLLEALRHQPLPSFLPILLKKAGLDVDHARLHLEYQVKPGEGRGTASHTDLMCISEDIAVAVEVKWTEQLYESVRHWLTSGSSEGSPENRKLVLSGWLKHLAPHADQLLELEVVAPLIYQMVHRAASAAAVATRNGGRPAMAYLVFHETDQDAQRRLPHYRSNLEALRAVVGNMSGFPFYLVSVQLHPTEAFYPMRSLVKGKLQSGQLIREALKPRKPPLFTFGEAQIDEGL